MIRSFLLIAFILTLTGFAAGQSWEDSLRIGKKLYQEKQFDKAYRTLLEAQKLAPSTVDLSQDIGNAAYRSQDYDMAEKAFRSAASKSDDQSHNAKSWHNVGNSQMKSKNYQAAVESYKQSLRKDPTDEKTRYNLAEAQRRVKVQQEQEQKQQEQNQENQKEGDQNEESNPSESDQEDQNKENQGEQNQDQKQNPKGQQGGNPDQKSNTEPESKLSDRKTERMLEDLLKQEMQTKKKVQGVESGNNQEQIKSGKRW